MRRPYRRAKEGAVTSLDLPLPDRRSLRLAGYDYRQAGAYFITICTHRRVGVFGQIVDTQMVLSPAGQIARACWEAIPEHFPDVILDEYIIMPDHLHGIIVIAAGRGDACVARLAGSVPGSSTADLDATGAANAVWDGRPTTGDAGVAPTPDTGHAAAGRDGRPTRGDAGVAPTPDSGRAAAGRDGRPTRGDACVAPTPAGDTGPADAARGRGLGGPRRQSLGAIIGSFKAAASQRIKQLPGTPDRPLWQRNYYEHVIRSEGDLRQTRVYIANNPLAR